MKKYAFYINLLIISIFSINIKAAEPVLRQHLLMDYNWKFIQSDVKNAEKQKFDDTGLSVLNLPHDWSIEGEFKEDAATNGDGGYLPAGIGWYRKHFTLSSIIKDQQYWIEFDGVYMNSDVWINGVHLGKHPNGYTGFYYDLTPHIIKGENVLAVRVDNSLQPNSRWYSGSGIYRHVLFNIASPVHIAQWGTYIPTPMVDSSNAIVKVRTSIKNSLLTPAKVVLRSVIKNESGKEIASIETPVSFTSSGKTEIEQIIPVNSPSLWSTDKPSLYTLNSYILEGTKSIDNLTSTFGIREIKYDINKGFLLNGKQVKMIGVCLHHEAGCLGAAVPQQAWIRRLQLLKEMGCNAIRTAHNPPAPEFLDLCDKIGFLVMDEAFDEWEVPKIQGNVKYGYHLYFAERSQSDLASIIYRDRNHPSVVLWSAGNEIVDADDDRDLVVLQELMDTYHKLDPTRPVLVTNDRINHTEHTAKLPFLDMQDIVGYNYIARWGGRRELYYSIDKYEHPNWKMVGTENGAVSGIRGSYIFGAVKPRAGRAAYYKSRMIAAGQLWRFTVVNDYVIGDFMWTGIDYLGESRWPNKNSSSGVIDLCGFQKEGYYFYQSQWTNKPMVHLFPHWNWAGCEGSIVSVIVYSNCDSVELFLNGKSFGVKSAVFLQQSLIWSSPTAGAVYAHPYIPATISDLHLYWDVPYEPGTLKVIGKRNGKIVSEDVRATSRPSAIRLSSDKKEIYADAQDIVNVKVEIVNDNGLVVPDANNLIEFKVEGEGILAGTDNGNPLDKTMMKSKQRSAFNGLALAVIQSTRESGEIRLIAVSKDLKDAVLQVASYKSDNTPDAFESIK